MNSIKQGITRFKAVFSDMDDDAARIVDGGLPPTTNTGTMKFLFALTSVTALLGLLSNFANG